MAKSKQTPTKRHDLSFEEPDYSGELTSPSKSGKDKKQKMKKSYPNLVVKDNPEMHQQMEIGKKYKAHVIVTPRVKRGQEGSRDKWDKQNEGHHMEMDVHSIEGIEPHEEPDGDENMETSKEESADFSTLGKK